MYIIYISGTQFSYVNGTQIHETDYKNSEDELSDKQEPEYLKWALKIFDEMLINVDAKLSDNGLDILVHNWPCNNSYIDILLYGSFTFFSLAVSIVLIYMTFHLQSLFLSFCAMFQILMSFPLGYLLYRIIFGIEYFDFLNTLIIFVLLGVGGDDVFVFTDAVKYCVIPYIACT